jgi:NAD(P)-dependent dehydrogenase (short-subunit alcohol dehydrogenase family)
MSAEEFSVSGRVVWLTGASRGIGETIARKLAAAGANLVLQARSESVLAEVCEKVADDGGEVEMIVGSVSDPEIAERAVQVALQRWGKLDGLVNNAGISPVMARTEALSLADWNNILEVNLTGTFVASAAAGRQMLAQGSGSIVNVSSVHGSVAAPRLAAYAATKGGIDMLTRTLAVEWADRGVRVNAIAPGYVETAMTEGLRSSEKWSDALTAKIPMGRFATPDELVPTVQFLLSEASRYLTGSIVNVDGGWVAQ